MNNRHPQSCCPASAHAEAVRKARSRGSHEVTVRAVRLMMASYRRGAGRPSRKEPTVPEGVEDPQVHRKNPFPS
ncbi:integrase catalytic region [Streptomyces viridosporus ATCC 14672]|uniref:Integrase catalytic region n=1 Tax=Streptomyces viridosporus (strain ATCC 14672 / DSM 40746 / JCM 4963 / KCTC 9882 / NRRL B-12104 / FH 1290) TaxID=566461 RepID=D5ZNU4_STRV1|nr:integrase catalytic region [Streptomyces viridosporus ATCC 14672]